MSRPPPRTRLPQLIRRPAYAAPLAALVVIAVLAFAVALWPAVQAADHHAGSLLRQLNDGDVEARRRALLELANRGDFTAVPDVAAALRDEDAVVRKLAEQTLWEIWSRSGDEEVDELFKVGTGLLARGETGQSIVVFSLIIERAPQFAEGWNKRATAYYHMGEYEKSLVDIDETLKRNPYHFGALSGAGLCLIELERFALAVDYFDRALTINPNLDRIVELKRAVEKRAQKPVI